MTNDEARAVFDPVHNRDHAARNAEKAILLALGAADPFEAFVLLGREAVSGQAQSIAALAQTDDPAFIAWWRKEIADAFAARAVELAPHLADGPGPQVRP